MTIKINTKLLVTILTLTFLTNTSSANEFDLSADTSFICSSEFSSGYEYKNSRWVRERFRSDDRYQINYSDQKWTVYSFEEEYEFDNCGSLESDILKCNIDSDFIMNLATMKFSITSTDAYVSSTRRNRNPVVVTLGTCVKM